MGRLYRICALRKGDYYDLLGNRRERVYNGICSVEIAGSTEFAGELPDGFEAGFPYYRLMEGKLVHDGEKTGGDGEKAGEDGADCRAERSACRNGLYRRKDKRGAATRENNAGKALAERQSWRDEINAIDEA